MKRETEREKEKERQRERDCMFAVEKERLKSVHLVTKTAKEAREQEKEKK